MEIMDRDIVIILGAAASTSEKVEAAAPRFLFTRTSCLIKKTGFLKENKATGINNMSSAYKYIELQ